MSTCAICTSKSRSMNFGAESCRACAAFFRRAVVTGKKYICQGGSNACEIGSSRVICRKCRLQRCLNVGMKPEMVQSGKTIIMLSNDSKQPPTVLRRPKQQAMCSSSPSTSSSPEVSCAEYLQQLYQHYQTFRSRRHSEELKLLTMLNTVPHPTIPDLRMLVLDDFKILERIQVQLLLKLANEAFPALQGLENEEKELLTKRFFTYFWYLTCSYISWLKIPPPMFDEIELLSEFCCISIHNLDYFFKDADQNCVNFKEQYKLVKSFFLHERRRPMHLMAKMGLSEEELGALIGLCMYHDYNMKRSEECERICKEERAKIFDGLNEYYRSTGTTSLSRFGELMCLHNALLSQKDNFEEDIHLMFLYGMVEDDLYENMK